MVVCDPNAADETFQDKPVVIAEVVSDATRRIDEGEKREAYLMVPTLSVYLVIETDRPRVVAHRRGEHGFAAEVYEGTEAMIPLEAVDAELPLADLYERVDFTASEAK
jgi:Uma2 family endonuclease